MTRRLAALTLLLYPLAFRRRYGGEMRALLDETPPRALTLLDLLRGALAAHLRPPAGLAGVLDPIDRLRASTSGVLACWVVFAAAGFGFYKTTEDNRAAGNAHPLLGDAHFAVQVLALLGCVGVLAGALPLILLALGHARRDRSLRTLVCLPVLAVIAFAALTALLGWFGHAHLSRAPTTVGGVAFIAWGLAGLACGAVCLVASRKVLFALPIARSWLLTAFACATLVSATMAAITFATALYAITLPFDASALAAAPNGPLQTISTSASLIVQLIVMAIAGGLAVTTTRRGWRAISQSDSPETA
jgi:hypothetical protein